MKQILPAIFTSVWKRKETKIYLLFVLFPVIFLLASFFGKSNFMQISVIGDNRVSGIAFLDMMISSADSFILPTLAIYFLTISVFRREIEAVRTYFFQNILVYSQSWYYFIFYLLVFLQQSISPGSFSFLLRRIPFLITIYLLLYQP